MGDTRGSDEAPLLAPIDPDRDAERRWVKIEPGDLAEGRVTTVVAGDRPLCVSRTEAGIGVLDNHCPHQGGPLGDGEIDENGNVICPWHGYEYDPVTGRPPAGFDDGATCYPVEERDDGVYVELPIREARTTLMDQLVATLVDWGIDSVFGMVGHSNLGLADAFRKAEEAGDLRYFGIRHEGAAAFAASGYAKLTGRPAACFSIAGPGATNLLTGLYDAKVDRVPILAMTGQVQSQVLGPGTFQEVDLAAAFAAGERVESDRAATRERHRARCPRRQARGGAAGRRPPDLPGRGAGAPRPAGPARSDPAGVGSPRPRSHHPTRSSIGPSSCSRRPRTRSSSSATVPVPSATRSCASPTGSTHR